MSHKGSQARKATTQDPTDTSRSHRQKAAQWLRKPEGEGRGLGVTAQADTGVGGAALGVTRMFCSCDDRRTTLCKT